MNEVVSGEKHIPFVLLKMAWNKIGASAAPNWFCAGPRRMIFAFSAFKVKIEIIVKILCNNEAQHPVLWNHKRESKC